MQTSVDGTSPYTTTASFFTGPRDLDLGFRLPRIIAFCSAALFRLPHPNDVQRPLSTGEHAGWL